MGNKTVENQEKMEVNGYKSAHELATALDKKNKELANKIRSFAEKQIVSDSQNWRLQLKEELTPSEQKEIREAIPSEAKNFDKGMSDVEIATQKVEEDLAGVVGGAEATKAMGKFEGFLQRFDNAGDVYKKVAEAKGGMAGTFAGIMAAIMYFLTGKTPEGIEFPWSKKGAGEKKEAEKGSNTGVDIKYQVSSSAVSKIFGGKSKDTLNKLFTIDKFQNLTYSQTKDLYNKYSNTSNKNGLAKEVGIEGVSGNEVFKALGVIVDEQTNSGKLLPDFYKKKGEAYEEKTIKELIAGLYSNIKIFKSLENITTPDQIINAGKNFGLQIEHLSDGKIDIKGEIYDSLEELGLSKNIIIFIQMRGGFKNITELEKNLNGIQTELSESDKNILKEKLIPFAKNINNTLSNNFGGKYSNKVLDCLNKKNLDLKETLEIFALTGGNYDFSKMNDMQKTYIYTKLISLIDDRDNELAGRYGTYIVNEGETPLPSGVKAMFSYLGNKLLEGGEKIGKNLLGAAKENPMTAGIIALTLWFGPFFSAKESVNFKMGRIFKKR